MKEIRRNTKQRQIILEELMKLKTHPSAADLYAIVRQRIPRISLGTVYRNLELLSRTGIIKKIDMSGRQSRFDADPDSHYHIRCSRCGSIGDIHDSPVTITESEDFDTRGWKILKHRIDFIGICPKCKGSEISNDVIEE